MYPILWLDNQPSPDKKDLCFPAYKVLKVICFEGAKFGGASRGEGTNTWRFVIKDTMVHPSDSSRGPTARNNSNSPAAGKREFPAAGVPNGTGDVRELEKIVDR